MPVERHAGGTSITGAAVDGYAALTLYHAMRLYIETNGKMQASRFHTPAAMRQSASYITGKVYARSRKGLERAYADLGALISARGNLDAIGETMAVNKLVGGVAADLADDNT